MTDFVIPPDLVPSVLALLGAFVILLFLALRR
jgi:hypothetical protein